MHDPAQLTSAFALAAGRAPESPPPPPALVRWALELLALRALGVEAPPCPGEVRARAHGLYGTRAHTIARRVAALLFDSAADLGPARRGVATRRTLRFGSAGVYLDVQIQRRGRDYQVHVATPIEGEHRFVRVRCDLLVGDVDIELDEHGSGSVGLPSHARRIVLELHDADGLLLYTAPVEVVWEATDTPEGPETD